MPISKSSKWKQLRPPMHYSVFNPRQNPICLKKMFHSTSVFVTTSGNWDCSLLYEKKKENFQGLCHQGQNLGPLWNLASLENLFFPGVKLGPSPLLWSLEPMWGTMPSIEVVPWPNDFLILLFFDLTTLGMVLKHEDMDQIWILIQKKIRKSWKIFHHNFRILCWRLYMLTYRQMTHIFFPLFLPYFFKTTRGFLSLKTENNNVLLFKKCKIL